MEKNKLKNFELFIQDILKHGVYAISLVTEGAIERDFVHFAKEHLVNLSIKDEDKRIVCGPILIPNKTILRKDTESGEYYNIFFSEDTVRETARTFLKHGNQTNTTYEHLFNVDGVTFVETWVKDDVKLDKSSIYGYEDLPIGTWFGLAKIDNDKLWEDIKEGKINGFSIEGRFADKLVEAKKVEDVKLSEEDILKKIMELIENIDEDSEE